MRQRDPRGVGSSCIPGSPRALTDLFLIKIINNFFFFLPQTGIFCIGEIRRKQPSVFHDPQQKLHDELVTEEHLALTAMALFLI